MIMMMNRKRKLVIKKVMMIQLKRIKCKRKKLRFCNLLMSSIFGGKLLKKISFFKRIIMLKDNQVLFNFQLLK